MNNQKDDIYSSNILNIILDKYSREDFLTIINIKRYYMKNKYKSI